MVGGCFLAEIKQRWDLRQPAGAMVHQSARCGWWSLSNKLYTLCICIKTLEWEVIEAGKGNDCLAGQGTQ